MADPINWNDPCARAQALREAYWRLVAGQQESEFEYQGNGVMRRARFSQGNLTELANQIRVAEAECAAQQGGTTPRPRYAIQAGSRRVMY